MGMEWNIIKLSNSLGFSTKSIIYTLTFKAFSYKIYFLQKHKHKKINVEREREKRERDRERERERKKSNEVKN